MPNKLENPIGNLPSPLAVVDAVGDSVMQVPATVGRVIGNVAGAISGGGRQMESAANRVANTGGLPDPGTVVGAAVDFVAAVPSGLLGAVTGGLDGVRAGVDGIVGNVRKLGPKG